jgi:hypothetical protein
MARSDGRSPPATNIEPFRRPAHLTQQHVTSPLLAPSSTYKVSEPDLIARVLAGDRIAARELYDAHSARVFRLAYRLTGDGDLAREFTQDTFVRAFGQLSKFRGDSAFSTWIYPHRNR